MTDPMLIGTPVADNVDARGSATPGLWEHPPRVLIVDDEHYNRELLRLMLSPEGYELRMAVSGEEALAILATNEIDLILLDVMMPGMDGYEVARRIKTDPDAAYIPIMMVTALDDRNARLLGLGAGAEDFLSKPVDRAELCVRARNLLRMKAYGDYYGKYSGLLELEVTARTTELVERTATSERNAAALHASEYRMNYALGSALMGVWEVDLVTRSVTWSDTMRDVFGVSAVPATLDEYLALTHPDDLLMVTEAYTREGGGDLALEHRVMLTGGATRWVSVRARFVCDADGVPVRLLGLSADISERRSLEAQLRQAQKMDAIGRLAGGIAHDFNNLLTAILGYSGFVLGGLTVEDESFQDMQEVIKAAQRATSLTNQLLAFSRKQVLQPTIVDLNAMVADMRGMLARLIGEQVDLVQSLAPDLHAIRADGGQLEQVLMNLVINARDAMPLGGRLVVETANVDLDESFMSDVSVVPGSYVLLAVSDSGIGMSEHTRQRMFEPFFTTKLEGQGTGLGLATVYGIVKQSGGYIWVYSELGRGSTFKLYFPRAPLGTPAPENALADAAPTGGSETLLVVEDDPAVRRLTSRILEEAGYNVFTAANPKHAESVFAQHPDRFDMLVTDVIMPGKSGPALYQELSKRRPDLRVLYVSGYTDDTILRQGEVELGVQLLQKPFTAPRLCQRVRELLDQPGAGMQRARTTR